MNLAFVPNLSIITLAWFSHGHALEANRSRSDYQLAYKTGLLCLFIKFRFLFFAHSQGGARSTQAEICANCTK